MEEEPKRPPNVSPSIPQNNDECSSSSSSIDMDVFDEELKEEVDLRLREYEDILSPRTTRPVKTRVYHWFLQFLALLEAPVYVAYHFFMYNLISPGIIFTSPGTIQARLLHHRLHCHLYLRAISTLAKSLVRPNRVPWYLYRQHCVSLVPAPPLSGPQYFESRCLLPLHHIPTELYSILPPDGEHAARYFCCMFFFLPHEPLPRDKYISEVLAEWSYETERQREQHLSDFYDEVYHCKNLEELKEIRLTSKFKKTDSKSKEGETMLP